MESVGDSSDVQWKTSGCNRKRSVTDSGQTSTSNVQRVDEAERSRRLASVSAGRRSSSHRYVGARPCWHFVRQNSDLIIGDPLKSHQPVKSAEQRADVVEPRRQNNLIHINFKNSTLHCIVIWLYTAVWRTRLLYCYYFWCAFYCFYLIDYDRFICFYLLYLF